jgi:hypothetical protein
LTEANENPSRIPVTVSEDLVVGDVLKFGPVVENLYNIFEKNIQLKIK